MNIPDNKTWVQLMNASENHTRYINIPHVYIEKDQQNAYSSGVNRKTRLPISDLMIINYA
jgi:hypothetical protein